jgi:hypothetical protein
MRRTSLVILLAIAALPVLTPPASAHGPFVSDATNFEANCAADWFDSNVAASAYIQENGTSGTEKFKVIFTLQWWTGEKWQNDPKLVYKSGKFPDDETTYYFIPSPETGGRVEVDATPAHQDKYIRMRVTFVWLSLDPLTVLHRHFEAGPYCLVGGTPA